MEENKIEQLKEISWVVIVTVVVGILAGVVGTVLTENYLYQYTEGIDKITIPLRLAEQKPKPLPGTYEEAIEQIYSQAVPSLVNFYQKVGTTSSIEKMVYQSDEILASGAVVTSDGWLVTASDLFNTYASSGLVVVIGRDVYQIEQVVTDQATGFVFVKIDGNNLPVLAFGASDEVGAGDLVFVVPTEDTIVATSIKSIKNLGSVIHPAWELQKHFLLADNISGEISGAPLTNTSGELIGLVSDIDLASGETVVRPLHHLLPVIQSVLYQGSVSRSYMGLSIVDLANTIGLSEELSLGMENGALIVRDSLSRYVSGVIPGGPAEIAGLINNDIVLEVNRQMITNNAPLAEILLDYSPGDIISLKINRAGQEIELDLVLDELL
ncbi:MAG: S1C family serine protease [Candidatus Uhrbacteria bacterium]